MVWKMIVRYADWGFSYQIPWFSKQRSVLVAGEQEPNPVMQVISMSSSWSLTEDEPWVKVPGPLPHTRCALLPRCFPWRLVQIFTFLPTPCLVLLTFHSPPMMSPPSSWSKWSLPGGDSSNFLPSCQKNVPWFWTSFLSFFLSEEVRPLLLSRLISPAVFSMSSGGLSEQLAFPSLPLGQCPLPWFLHLPIKMLKAVH